LQYRSPTAEPVQLVVYSLAGVPVYQSKSNGWLDETIESNTLRPGVYIAVLTTATQRLSRRLVVQ
ncbi:MAG: T9SS type A sorting domain-containing protein, partial [Bacteroidota bacterium]